MAAVIFAGCAIVAAIICWPRQLNTTDQCAIAITGLCGMLLMPYPVALGGAAVFVIGCLGAMLRAGVATLIPTRKDHR